MEECTIKKLIRIPRVRNDFGVRVKKSCKSCQMKEVGYDGEAICSKTGKKVEGNEICQCWEMCEQLNLNNS